MSYKAIMKHSPRSFACPGFHAAPLSRRQMIKVGGLGLLGLTLPQLLRAEALKKGPKAKAKSVIFLFQWGGPSHLDMFDMKPNAPEQIRGPHKPISSSADGIQVSERLPRVSKVMDKVTLIRSVYHTMKNHNSAGYYALSGSAPPSDEKYHLPITEQTLPTLLNDLETRGLLDTTLVVWMGEFGRTPRINDNASRDHWPQCYTALLAGGGVKRGFVYGASDKNGAYPAENPVRPDDLAATIYHLLGMRERLEMVGGRFSVESAPGKGTTVRAEIPVANGDVRSGALTNFAQPKLKSL